MVKFLHNATNLDYGSVHLIGHSLGAHVCGYAGERLPGLGCRSLFVLSSFDYRIVSPSSNYGFSNFSSEKDHFVDRKRTKGTNNDLPNIHIKL
jgi:pimeloyl-ACP methyl ester carboxylesterase